ncbi:MAG: Radical domain protein [Acidimicrobiales bacterium]|nr:Radical domain protein [Acidimicrobiales bacterium]
MARIAFCQDGLIEYMGYMQMASVLKAEGHQVEIFFDDQLHQKRFLREMRRFRPDVVGFSVLTPSRPWAIALAEKLRSLTGAITVCGNVDAILNPDAIAESGAFDLVCTGEGEVPLTELAAAVDAKADWSRIKGFWTVRPDGEIIRNDKGSLVDMNELPPIDRDIYDKYRFFRRSPYLRVYVGRGCPFRCSFCSNTTLTEAYGGNDYLRKRDPARFIADLEALVASRPNEIKRIFLIDEVLWFDRKWLHEFLVLYRDRIGIPFTMHFKFNGGVTEEDVALMGEAGAVAVVVAAETGDEHLRRNLMNKPVSNNHILRITGWMKKHDVRFGTTAFFGLPGQTFEKHLEELDFYREVGGIYLWSTFFQPYPGLELTEQPEIAALLAEPPSFESTLHTQMYLDVPDRVRLVNLKKVYFLMFRFPKLQRPLARLCHYRIPLLFDVLFALHFTYYYLLSEGCSVYQFLVHAKDFGLNPVLRRIQPLNTSGRPFDPGYGPSLPATPTAAEPADAQPADAPSAEGAPADNALVTVAIRPRRAS